MNFGECPYEDCDEVLFLVVPKETPAFTKFLCDGCGRLIWYRFSRFDPMAWTLNDFPYEVDEQSKQITANTP